MLHEKCRCGAEFTVSLLLQGKEDEHKGACTLYNEALMKEYHLWITTHRQCLKTTPSQSLNPGT